MPDPMSLPGGGVGMPGPMSLPGGWVCPGEGWVCPGEGVGMSRVCPGYVQGGGYPRSHWY